MWRFDPICFRLLVAIGMNATTSAASLTAESANTLEQIQNLEPLDKVWSDAAAKTVFANLVSGVAVITNYSAPILKLPLRPPVVSHLGGFVGKYSSARVVARCNADGSIDNSYLAPTGDADDARNIVDIAAQPDGKVVVACSSSPSPFEGSTIGLFRLNSDGSFDSSFRPAAFLFTPVKVLVQSDSKVLAVFASGITRYLVDGTVDTTFERILFGTIRDAVLQNDGKIVVAGTFSKIDGFPRKYVARLNPNGFVDTLFTAVIPAYGSPPTTVRLQSDGSVVADIGIVTRFSFDGAFDKSFPVPGIREPIYGVGVDKSDRVYFNWGPTVRQYSGRNRVQSLPADVPTILEQASSLAGPWNTVTAIPANNALDYPLPNLLGPPNAFFRTVPAP
jgi:uncharacterized delta-60 repeat protein